MKQPAGFIFCEMRNMRQLFTQLGLDLRLSQSVESHLGNGFQNLFGVEKKKLTWIQLNKARLGAEGTCRSWYLQTGTVNSFD